MGIEHLLNNMNKDTKRGYLAYSHTHRLLSQFNHWPNEALESNPLKLPTLRVLRLASTITNLSLDNLPPLTRDNAIAASIRQASQAIDDKRHQKRHTIQGTMGSKEYDKLVRQQCLPIHYSNKLLKHLTPLWETGVTHWNSLITKTQDPDGTYTYQIQPTPAIIAKLPKGHRYSPKLQLKTAIHTLRATLLLPATTEHKKLPKDNETTTTTIHHTWHQYINTADIPDHTPHSYATLKHKKNPIYTNPKHHTQTYTKTTTTTHPQGPPRTSTHG
jgi:hypothetical protein